MSLIRRSSNVETIASDNDLQPASGLTVIAYLPGGVAASASSGTSITCYSGHGFAVDDRLMVDLDESTFRLITAVSGNVLTVAAVVVNTGDVLVNLGLDGGTTEPDYLGSTAVIYSTPDTTTVITDSQVTTDTGGEYGYWHTGVNHFWELVLNSSGAPIEIIMGTFDPSLTSSDITTTDNAIARWDGTNGRTLQDGYTSNTPTISDAGAVVVPGTLNTTGLITATTITASGLITASANVTVGTTIGVTGVATLTGGIANGIPRNVGTWQPPTATPGTYKQPTTTEMYVGSIFIPANMTVTGIKYLIGTAVPTTQKLTVALFNTTGTKVAASTVSGTTMTGSASVTQSVPFTGTYAAVGPGWHFIGLMFDTATANLFCVVPTGADAGNGVVGSIVTGLTALTPPSSITAPTIFTASAVPIASLY